MNKTLCIFFYDLSFGPAAILGGQMSPLLSLGEGDPPCHIGPQEAGTCIYNLLYITHWAPGLTSSWSFTAVNVVEELLTIWAALRSL